MRVLLVHPSALMYSEIFLRLEPLGLERVAAALLADGHDVRLVDLQVYRRSELEREVAEFAPEAVGFSLNYLANVPEVVDLAKWLRAVRPGCLIFAGGHSVSFVAEQVHAHAEGAIDAVLKGEGETGAPALLAAAADHALKEVPGVVTLDGPGRPPATPEWLLPARDRAVGRRVPAAGREPGGPACDHPGHHVRAGLGGHHGRPHRRGDRRVGAMATLRPAQARHRVPFRAGHHRVVLPGATARGPVTGSGPRQGR